VDGGATLTGDVRVLQGDRELHADQAHYDPTKHGVHVEGRVDYTDPLLHVTGSGGNYSQTDGADFTSAQFEMRERPARGAADFMNLAPNGLIQLKNVKFTTCPVNDSSWQLRAESITLDTHAQIGTGHDTQIDFQGVPLLYLPWMSFPLGTERKSGFLFPTIGNSSRGGVQLSVPYYWNIEPNMDLTFTPQTFSKRGINMDGDFRYMTASQHGDLSFDYLPDDRVAHEDRSRIKLEHVTELPHDFRFAIDAENVSDPNYFEDFSQGSEGTSTAFLERVARVTYRDEHWRFNGEFQQYQTIDQSLLDIYRPYARVPRIETAADFTLGAGEHLHYGFDSELVDFQRAIGVKG
jgi:LPS-assembly protein